jgi:hypothetical protein
LIGQYCVHELKAADNRVDRAGLDAEGAADTAGFINPGQLPRTLLAVGGVERQHGQPCQRTEFLNSGQATWGALVDVGVSGGDRVCVITTTGIAATRALRLWQNGVNGF